MFKELLKNKLAEQAAIVNKAIAESRAMTEEEQVKFDSLEVEIKNFEKTIEAQAKIDAKVKEDNTPVNSPIYAEPRDANAKKWKAGAGEFFQAVKNAYTPGGMIDNRLFKNAASGMNENVGSEGGFLVDSEISTDLMGQAYDATKVYQKTDRMPVGANYNGVKINLIDETSRVDGSRSGGVQMYWAAEADTKTASKPKTRQFELKLEKLLGFCYATDEMLQDSSVLGNFITRQFVKEAAFKLDDGIINGTGVGQMTGIMISDALVTVAKEAGQPAQSVLFENIVKMYARMYDGGEMNAEWYINRDIIPQLFTMSMAVGTGGVPVYLPANGAAGVPTPTLLGLPVNTIEQCATLGTTGDIILADMSQYMTVEKNALQTESSIHVRFLYDEQVFRFTYRANGAPTWKSALTPYKGSATRSPFITLATRA